MGKTVLIVDRHEATRRSLRYRLRDLGFHVVEADGVDAARSVLVGGGIQVQVVDLASLGDTGLLLISPTRRPETILLTRPEHVPLSIRGMKLGAFDDLPLPIDIDILERSIRSALERTERRGRSSHREPPKGRNTMEDFKVLLVDDEEDFLESLSERLKLRKVNADTAKSGAEALERIQDDEPTVIVLDLKMPGMHGLEVLKRLKKTNPDVQVVILTGHGSEEDRKEAERLGAYAYHSKPVRMDTLMKSIRGAYKRFQKLKRTVDTAFMASAMAQAGEVELARELMKEEEEEQDERRTD
jgi:DNA-binding NtrC family response regulator